MVKSIRVRLLLWSGVMLSLVVGGFAGLVFVEYRNTRLAEVDSQLEVAANSLDAGLRQFPAYELRGEEPPFGGRGGFLEKGPKGGRPTRKEGGEPGFPPFRDRLLSELGRLISELGLPNRSEGIYYAVWRANGTLIKSQGLIEDTPRPFGALPRPVFETRQDVRELVVLGPQQTVLLLGRSMQEVHADIQNFALSLVLAGIFMMLIGLLGGWMISRRIFRPIATISETASRISANSLSQRIDESKLDIELVDLAKVLNDTFQNLEESFERQRQFTADASHELRTPLAVLRSQAELTLSRTRTVEEYQQALRYCLLAAERMTELTNRLLRLAQADAGQLNLKQVPVPILPLLEDTADQLRPLATKHDVKVRLDVEPMFVMGDPAALEQVFVNLLSNAISYNRPGGSVRIESLREGRRVRINLTDTGVGISAKDLPHLFERFYRVDQARSRAKGGHGLGLAISKAIIEAMGGEVGCESIEGEGSTFWVRLPLTEPNPAEQLIKP